MSYKDLANDIIYSLEFDISHYSDYFRDQYKRDMSKQIEDALKKSYEDGINEATVLVQALNLIAAPKRSDGTYNRNRESCELLARKALDEWNKK